MPRLNRNACRVCLGEGLKPIYGSSGRGDLGLQYDRILEKLRYVSMLPIPDQDNGVLPNMLCYTCIVQLNAAYNFKTTMVETTMYLDRLSIESGNVSVTPAPSSITDDDRASVVSSVVPVPTLMPPPPAIYTTSLLSEASSPDSGVERGKTSRTNQERTSRELQMLEPSQIKTEPDNEEDEEQFVLREAMKEAMLTLAPGKMRAAPSSTGKRKLKATKAPPARTSPRCRRSFPLVHYKQTATRGSPTKKPMVAVHAVERLERSSEGSYIDNLLRRHLHKDRDSDHMNSPNREVGHRSRESGGGNGSPSTAKFKARKRKFDVFAEGQILPDGENKRSLRKRRDSH